MFKMLELQYLGKIDSGLSVGVIHNFCIQLLCNTKNIMTKNEGFSDNLGSHNFGKDNRWKVEILKSKIDNIETSLILILRTISKYHDMSFYNRCGYFKKVGRV